jgi:hypothetical protein
MSKLIQSIDICKSKETLTAGSINWVHHIDPHVLFEDPVKMTEIGKAKLITGICYRILFILDELSRFMHVHSLTIIADSCSKDLFSKIINIIHAGIPG